MKPVTSSRRIFALALPASSALLVTPALAQSTWSGGTNNQWSNAANWSPGIPASGANITIADTTTNNLQLNDGPKTIGSLTFGGTGTRTATFTIDTTAANSLTLTSNDGIAAGGLFTAGSNALTMRGHYTVAAPQTWNVGATVAAAATHDPDHGIFVREVTTGVANRGSLTLGANLTKTGNGQLLFAAIDITGPGNLIVNEGLLKYNAGASQPLVIAGTGNVTLNNSAILAVYKNSGTLNITRPTVLNDNATLATQNGVVDFGSPLTFNGTHSLDIGTDAANVNNFTGSWSGAGTVTRIKPDGNFGNGPLNLSGDLSGFTGTFNNSVNAPVNIQGPFGGNINVNAGTLTLGGAVAGDLSLTPGASLVGEVTVSGNVTLFQAAFSIDASTPASLAVLGDLTLDGVNTVNLSVPPSSTAPFTVLTYSGNLTGGLPNLTLLGGTSSYRNPFFADTGSAITLALDSESRTWDGGTGIWDINTSENWLEGDKRFYQLDAVTFGDAGAGNVTVSGVISPLSIVIDSTSDYTFTVPDGNSIAGTATLEKSGTGTVSLGGLNTFSGNINVTAGTLRSGRNQSFGGRDKTITVAPGAMIDTGGTMDTNHNYHAIVAGDGVGGAGVIVNTGGEDQNAFGSLTLTGDAAIGGSGRWDVRGIGGNGSFSGIFDLAGHDLTKIGSNKIAIVDVTAAADGNIHIAENSGTLAFTRSNVSGAGSVNVGPGSTLQFENYTAGSFAKPVNLDSATLMNSGAAFTPGAGITIAGTSTFNIVNNSLTLANPLAGSGSLTKIGPGTLILVADNTYDGDITIAPDTNPETPAAGAIQIGNGALNGSIPSGGAVTLVSTTAALRFNCPDDIAFANVITGEGVTGNDQNPSAVTKDGANTLTLTGANTYTGSTRITGGTVAIGSDQAFGLGTAAGSVVDARAGTIRSSDASSRTIGNNISYSGQITWGSPGTGDLAFTGTVALGNGSKTATVNNAVTEFSGVLFDNGAPGANTFTKTGPGRLILSGANTYGHHTVINQGILQIGNGGATGTLNPVSTVTNNASLVFNLAEPEEDAFHQFGNLISGTGSLTKDGSGQVVLTEENTYTGNTDILAGTLTIDKPFLADESTVRIAAGATLDFFFETPETTDTIASLVIGNEAQPAGIYGPIDSGAQFEIAALTGDGLLEVTTDGVTGGYDTWAAQIADPDRRGFDIDADDDGIHNGLEYILGGNPNTSDSSILPASEVTDTHFVFTFDRSDESEADTNLVFQWSSDLGGWNDVPVGSGNSTTGGVTVEVAENGNDPDTITVRVPRSSAAGGKLFGRLSATQP